MKNSNLFKKNDLLLVLIIVLVTLLLCLVIFLSQKSASTVLVKIGSDEIGRYSLDQNRTVKIQGGGGENILVIEEGCAYIKEADCPDLLCVYKGKISKSGESIVCLPHKVSVTVIE